MTSERWQQVKELLNACLELPRAERAGYLDRTCAGDAALRAEVESLISSYDDADDVLERPLHPAEDKDAMAGQIAGEYRFVREIGEGGMSRVYLGQRLDGGSPREVAIKVVKRGMDYEFVLRRFRHERQIMAALDHPNIARLLGGGATPDGIPYFVMEYIPGVPIDEYCDKRRLTVRERLELFRTVCSAAQYAHERGVVHRDIKPGNILITDDGTVKLLDFGIAKVVDPSHWTHSFDLTASVLRLMTPEYASPEQVRGEYIFEPTDIYSLGVLLFELLTGRRPYGVRAQAQQELARAICEQEPGRPSSVAAHREEIGRLPGGTPVVLTAEEVSARRRTVPKRLRRVLAGDLDNIVLMALRKEPRRRYASVRELSEDIRRHLEGRPVTARKDTLGYRTGKFLGRHRKALIAAAVGLPLLAGAGATVWRWRGLADPPPDETPRIRPLTTLAGNERQPAFSPDGRRVAFVWSGEDGSNSDIYVRPLDGGALERVTSDPAEDVSPSWSPDGSRLAFLRTRQNRTAVFIAPLPSGPHALIAEVHPTRVEAVGRHLDWSPDGEYLVVADKESEEQPFSLFAVRAADGSRRRVTNPPRQTIGDTSPAVSPDGKRIAFLRSPSSGISELWTVPFSGGVERRLTHDNREAISQTWTPDGASLLFSSNRTGGYVLWRIAAAGGAPRRVPGLGDNTSEPAFSRDGRRLAFSQFFRDANIWSLKLGGDSVPARRLIASRMYDSSPQYSPDGRRIAFRSDRAGCHEIWTADADGRNPSRLTHFNGPLTGCPRWSPDGRWIAFDSRPEGQAEIYVMSASGGAARRLTHDGAEDVVPSWSRDGRWVYFGSNRSGGWQVWKVDASGGAKRQVTRGGGFAAFESPDGRTLYYALSRSLPGLYRMPRDGGPEEPVLPDLKAGYWGYWAPASDGIYYADRPSELEPPGLFFFRFSNGSRTRLADVDKSLTTGDSGLALSPDGTRLLFTQLDQGGSDLMLAELGSR